MLRIRNLSKKLGEFSLGEINLDIEKGDYFVLLGPSGAGKTVLFETISGINSVDKGTIELNGKDITRVKISDRNIGLVFQDGAVFPHLSVEKNIGYPLRAKKSNRAQKKETIQQLAEQMGIADLLQRKPGNLSGGELRRVAIARTLALEPDCLLLDEPLSSIDTQVKDEILLLLRKLNQTGLTILHITHDYREAFSQATKIAVIDKGKIIQQGEPTDLVKKPASKFIARFLGIKNYFAFASSKNEIVIQDKIHVQTSRTLPEKGHIIINNKSLQINTGKTVKSTENSFPGRVISSIKFPNHQELIVDIGIQLIVIPEPVFSEDINVCDTVTLIIEAKELDFVN